MNTMKQSTKKMIAITILASLPIISGQAEASNPVLTHPQIAAIKSLIDDEKDRHRRGELITLLNRLDGIYSDIHQVCDATKKLVVFLDPAHGLTPGGDWQGGILTGRQSCTNVPEELYSLTISRKLYSLLKSNPAIEVRSTDDYLAALEGKRNTYRDIPGEQTVDLARKAGAFIILSEHLNNVSQAGKSDGLSDIRGIHVFGNYPGKKALRFVRHNHTGFLTLYNRFDASGFSRRHALLVKQKLISAGMKPNTWADGVVPDGRFCYFIDYPISIIYESGFISNPAEEKAMSDPATITRIATAHYEALLEAMKQVFGIDISRSHPRKMFNPPPERMVMLKLSRMCIYYLRLPDYAGAIRVINAMDTMPVSIEYAGYRTMFNALRSRLAASQSHHDLAVKNPSGKSNAALVRDLVRSRSFMRGDASLTSFVSMLDDKILSLVPRKVRAARSPGSKVATVVPRTTPGIAAEAVATSITQSIGKPFVFVMHEGQSLEAAIEESMAPDRASMRKLLVAFRCYVPRVGKNVKKNTLKPRSFFVNGIYVVHLTASIQIARARRVESVQLDPLIYQNHLYLKNSFFSNDSRIRKL